jgi:hypothetical protein
MSEETYNGWTNRETWAAALHLSNDEGLYRFCVDLVREADSIGEAAETLGDWFEDEANVVFHPFEDEGVAPEWGRLMLSDVGSLWRVDWYAVAESFVEEESVTS